MPQGKGLQMYESGVSEKMGILTWILYGLAIPFKSRIASRDLCLSSA
ncbi:hypothetical protein [Magnetococcus marinus]|nr:hypothetical protein [Magnetococcus marinus]